MQQPKPSPVQSLTRAVIILAGVVIFALLMPIAAPIVGLTLVASGIVLYRQGADPVMRSIAVGSIVAGALLSLVSIFLLFFQLRAR